MGAARDRNNSHIRDEDATVPKGMILQSLLQCEDVEKEGVLEAQIHRYRCGKFCFPVDVYDLLPMDFSVASALKSSGSLSM